jgi:hypothetical protein
MIETEIKQRLDAATRALGDAMNLCVTFSRRNGHSPKVASLKKTRRDIGRVLDSLRSIRGLRTVIDLEDPDLMTDDERAMAVARKQEKEPARSEPSGDIE